MAKGVNKVILIGNIGKDPETKFFPNGDAVCNVTLATSESWTDKASGEKKERTEWHNVVFMRKLAEIAGQYLKKGSKVYVEGSLRTRKWEKDGQDRYTTEIVAQDMQMLDGKPTEQHEPAPSRTAATRPSRTPAAPQPGASEGFRDDEIPFAPISKRKLMAC